MTTQSTTTPHTPTPVRRRALPSAPTVAGIAFVAAWTAGLAVWPTNLALNASDATVFTAYTRHQAAAVTQYLLVEGLAAAALAFVVVSFGQAAGRRGAGRLGRLSVLAGIGAAIVSLIECVLGLLLARAADLDGNANRAGDLFDLINRLDAVKMLALATMALTAAALVRRDRLLPAWLGHTAVLLASAMTASSAGYLLLNNTIAQAAALSLPLLLMWVAGTGITLGRRAR